MLDLRGTLSAVAVAARNENVRRVELAWGLSIASEWAHFVVLGVFAYHAGGATAVGIAGLIRLLPAALIAPFAASLADRFPRERFLLAVTVLGTAALAASAVAAWTDRRALVYAFAAAVGLSTTLTRPTLQALLPSLARTPEELISANAATSTIESVGTLAGPLLAGLLLTLASVGTVFAVAAGAVAVASLLVARVHAEGAAPAVAVGGRGHLAGGFEVIARQPGPRLVVGLMIVQTFVRGCLNVLIVVAAFRVLGAGAGAVGYMTAAIGVGGLVGALGAMTLQGGRLVAPFALSLIFWGLPIALIAPHPFLAATIGLLVVVGAANSVEDVAGFTLLQRTVPDDALARTLGLFWGLAMGAVALGSLAAPALVRVLGARASFVLVGAILPVVSLAAYTRLRTLAFPAQSTEALELIHQVPMFAPLSLAAKERLARSLTSRSISAGDCVIRAGDVGDRFYIVADGAFEVDVGGTHKDVHPRDYFGEIALLRDVPRTATVTATTDSRLYELQRDDFLAAVTGHPGAERAGRDVVDARLAGA